MTLRVVFGLERCTDESAAALRNARFGLLMNRASVDADLRLACDVLAEAFPGQLRCLMTPQHGLWGDAQANMIETEHGWHPRLNVPIHSLYSETRRPTSAMLADIDTLVVDLQDVGTRVYTFIWTVKECLAACAAAGIRVLVLDRPNPIGGVVVEGPLLDPEYQSFVGGAAIPMRHALTIGEMARWLNAQLAQPAELEVVAVQGWEPGRYFHSLDRHWLPPSPNLPTPQGTLVYPGQVLLEGINLSEGRGTTTPFEVCGAPFVDALWLAEEMTRLRLAGLRTLPNCFRPTFDKWAGQLCGGVSLHVTDLRAFRSYRTTLSLLSLVQQRYGDDFRWLDPPYEYETHRPPIDIITGSDAVRAGGPIAGRIDELSEVDIDAWRQSTADCLIYGPAERFTT